MRAGTQVVQLRERLDRDAVAGGERGEGVATLHTIVRRCALAGEHLCGREPLREELTAPLRVARRQSQAIALRHTLRATPHRRQQRRVERAQLRRLHLEGVLERADGHVGRHFDLLEVRLGLLLQRAEILLRVSVDVQRGKERHVEVARGEAEGAAVVAAHDAHDVIRAERLFRPPHPGGAVVVGGDCERPGAEHTIVVGEQLRRGLRRAERVEPVVDGAVDAHIAPSRRAHELPQSGRADLGVGVGVERGLHVRQHGELGGKPEIGERLRDMRFPRTGADQAAPDAVRLPELEADVIDGGPQPGRGGLGTPQVADALVVGGQRLGGAAGNPPQGGRVTLACLVDQTLPLGRRGVGRKVQRLVHHTEIALVVKEARVGVDLGVHPDPELHVAFELRRTGYRVLGSLGARGHEHRQ